MRSEGEMMEEQHEIQPSKSQRKRESLALQDLGKKLVGLRREQLKRIPLPEALADAVLLAQSIRKRGALRRQLQYIGRLMRQIDPAPIEQALDGVEKPGIEEKARMHQAEQWRKRLLLDESDALNAWLAQHPDTEVQPLRQLIRNARREQEQGKPPGAGRRLFRYLSERLS